MKPKLIQISRNTHFPTAFPAFYFGTPDNKIYAIYSQFYGKSQFRYVIVNIRDKNLAYDYNENVAKEIIKGKKKESLFNNLSLNGYHKNVKVIDVGRLGKKMLTEFIAQSLLAMKIK